MKFIYSLTGLAVLAVVASSLVVHDRDSTADVKKREIHEVEREVVKREVTDEDVSNVCPNCSVGFVCCPGVNVSTCCQQDGLLRDSSQFLAMSPFAFKDSISNELNMTSRMSAQQRRFSLAQIIAAIQAGQSVFDTVVGLYDSAISVYGRFEGAVEFKDRHRSLELAIINGCSKNIRFSVEYFNSGTWFVSPEPLDLKPGEASIAYVANRQGSFATGVSGGLDYTIEGTGGLHLYLGFTNPQFGSYKNFIQVDRTKGAEWAYDNTRDDSVKKVTSNGFKLTCTMREPKRSSYKLFEYTIIDA